MTGNQPASVENSGSRNESLRNEVLRAGGRGGKTRRQVVVRLPDLNLDEGGVP
jgi:hypothetical protein